MPHRARALGLPRHDESAADVAVFDEALAKREFQHAPDFGGGGAAGVRHRNDRVNVVVGPAGFDAARQTDSHVHARAVDRNAVNDGVGARQIHIFKNARRVARRRRANARVHAPVHVYQHRLAGRDIAAQFVAEHIQRGAFRGEHVRVAALPLFYAINQRANAERVAEGEDAGADHQRHRRIRAAAAAVHAADRVENIFGRGAQARAADRGAQFMREHIQQDFRIGRGVQLAQVLAKQFLAQARGVGQVAVVPERDAERRIDIERLRLGARIAAGGRVAGVPDSHAAFELQHVALAEYIAHQSVVLAQIDALAVAGHDAGRVLAAVLDDAEALVEIVVGRAGSENADHAAHQTPPFTEKYAVHSGGSSATRPRAAGSK